MSTDEPTDDQPETDPVVTEQASTPEESMGPNLFADNRRRRIPGVTYCVIGGIVLAIWLTRMGRNPVLINDGVGVAGVLLIVFGVYSIFAGRGLDIDEEAALQHAAVAVQRPMGHASAQLGWRGWMSRPTWRILWYSAEDPPRHRGLVFVDGHDGEILDAVTQENPETDSPIDWGLEDSDNRP